MDTGQFPAGNFSLSLASLCHQSRASGIENDSYEVGHAAWGHGRAPLPVLFSWIVDVGVPVALWLPRTAASDLTKAQASFGAWRDPPSPVPPIGAAAKFPL